MEEIPRKTRADIARAVEYQKKWKQFQEKMRVSHMRVIRDLHKRGWSFRDIAPELGISYQRVGQLFKQAKM